MLMSLTEEWLCMSVPKKEKKKRKEKQNREQEISLQKKHLKALHNSKIDQ